MNNKNNKVMGIAIIVIVVGLAVLAYRVFRKREEDAEALFWATRREPLVFISEHPFDTTVESRWKDAIAKLEKHGNPFLKQWDVWVYVYRVHVPAYGAIEAIQENHSFWYDTVLRSVAARKMDWIETKSKFIREDAGRMFANQKTETV